MANEIEAKYRVKNFKDILGRLQSLKAVPLGEFDECDLFFDTESGELRSADKGLRLRITRTLKSTKAGGKSPIPAMLTYKGPRRTDSNLKIRREVQFEVGDHAATAEMLAALGFVPMLTVRKRRTAYSLGRCSVLLDNLRWIGMFVEVEGPSQRQVESTCRKLGLNGPTVTKSYAHLTAEYHLTQDKK